MTVNFECWSNFDVETVDNIASFQQVKCCSIDFVVFEDMSVSRKNIVKIFVDLIGRPIGSVDARILFDAATIVAD